MLEMVKDEKIIVCYLDIVKIISQHKELIPALLPLPKEFYPNQIESIQNLLVKLKGVAEIFLVVSK
jgi:hypothetical protein